MTDLASRQEGLSSAQAKELLARVGQNDGVEERRPLWVKILRRQLLSPFIYLLLIAAIVSGSLGQWIDTGFIVFFILLNTGLGFFQEYRSEQTARLLQAMVRTKARVLRDGKEVMIDALHVVPGDMLVCKPGDIIAADARVMKADGLQIDESLLSGESAPVSKEAKAEPKRIRRIFDATNVLFGGTSVAAGSGLAVVVVTGLQTQAHQMHALVATTEHTSTFERSIAAFSKFIIELILVTLAGVLLAHFFIKSGPVSPSELFVFAVALAVSVVPEALPVVTTFSLSQGARKLSRKHVIVKRLSAIEDLGSIDVLCTDKTGTLTENSLTVADVHRVNSVDPIAMTALSLVDEAAARHNPFDAAVLSAAKGVHKQKRTVIAAKPFDPRCRYETTIVKSPDGVHGIVRGAPEAVLALCKAISDDKRAALQQWIHDAGLKGQRILAVAGQKLPANHATADVATPHFYGCIAFVDPIKASTPEAVHQARALGVQVKILTGDRPEVAGVVARDIGLIDAADKVMTGETFFSAHETEQTKFIEQYHVFARVTPEQKLLLIRRLQANHSVGFLGEGINDAPALKQADVAIVVNEASDVARSAADIILMRKSLHVVVEGISAGRHVFANTLKYIRSTLSSNVGNFYAIAIASLFIDVLPLLPIQVLLVNLLTDVPMILIATDRVDARELVHPRGYKITDIASIALVLGLVSALFDFITFGVFMRFQAAVLQTNWFIVSVLTEILFLFSVRTSSWFFKSRPAGSLILLSCVAAIVALVLPWTAVGDALFHFQKPSAQHFVWIIAIVLGYFVTTESVKMLFVRSVDASNGKR